MIKLKLQYFGHLMQRTDSLEKTLMLGKIEGRRIMTEDEMVGWHHWLDGHEFEQAPGVGDAQGSLACCSPWVCKELDMTEKLNWTDHTAFSSPYLSQIYLINTYWVNLHRQKHEQFRTAYISERKSETEVKTNMNLIVLVWLWIIKITRYYCPSINIHTDHTSLNSLRKVWSSFCFLLKAR